MADYYQYAWLTIFATTTTSTEGLFGSMPGDDQPRITRLPYRDSQHEHQGYFYVQYPGRNSLWGDYESSVSNSDLRRRGWVCQEWFLSRRSLAFSGGGGHFIECQRDLPHTLLGEEVNTGEEDGRFTKSLLRRSLTSTLSPDWDASLRSVIEWWTKIVEYYSGLELTRFKDDRLVALSGLACAYGAVVDGKTQDGTWMPYVAGLWFGHLDGLLWEQAPSSEQRSRARARGMPTWSWASIGVPVRHENGTAKTDTNGEGLLSALPVRWPSLPIGVGSLRCACESAPFSVAGENF